MIFIELSRVIQMNYRNLYLLLLDGKSFDNRKPQTTGKQN